MKHSIIGNLNGIIAGSTDEQAVLDKLNSYQPIWRLVPSIHESIVHTTDGTEIELSVMSFEVWLETEIDKNDCFNDMKQFVDTYTGQVSYHVCSHDEAIPSPCEIIEVYIKEMI